MRKKRVVDRPWYQIFLVIHLSLSDRFMRLAGRKFVQLFLLVIGSEEFIAGGLVLERLLFTE